MKSIGIDIGTTTISVVVMESEHGAVLEAGTVPNDSFVETGRSWEKIQDVQKIVCRARGLLDGLLERHPDCASIGLTGQMHGIVYLNCAGSAVSPLYTWQDGRGNLPEFDGKTLVQVIKEASGIESYTGYGLVTHLYHVKKGLVPEDAVTFCTIADYLGMVLTGRRTPVVHASNAASFGFFDVELGCFKMAEMECLGMDTELLPTVTGTVDSLGQYRGIPVTVAIGDNQASFLGAAGDREHVVLLNMGTGGQISVLSSEYLEVPGIEARPFLNGTYLLVGASLCGGRAYAILERFFREYMKIAMAGEMVFDQYDVMEKLAVLGREEKDRMTVTTTFGGTRIDPDQRGSISGISEGNFTPEGMVYGVLYGMAKELHEFYREMDRWSHIPVEQLIGSGNGLRKNKVLREIFEEMFGVGLTLSSYDEEAACGAAISSTMNR